MDSGFPWSPIAFTMLKRKGTQREESGWMMVGCNEQGAVSHDCDAEMLKDSFSENGSAGG